MKSTDMNTSIHDTPKRLPAKDALTLVVLRPMFLERFMSQELCTCNTEIKTRLANAFLTGGWKERK